MTDKPRYNPAFHHRCSIRLKGYDYSQTGAYFITICAHNRECLFGEIVGSNGIRLEMRLNEYGEIVWDEWEKSAHIRAEIELGEFVVMPNHFHAIVLITGRGDRPVAPTKTTPPTVAPTPNGPKSKSIGALMSGFKSAVTKRINETRATPGMPVWQRNYWEHIIRDEKSCHDIATYILNNSTQWEMDKLYPGGNP